MSKKENGKAIAVLEPKVFDLAVIAQGSAEVQENLNQIDIRLPVIKIIHQAQMFEMPDGEKVKTFSGLILDFNKIQSYWPKSFDEDSGVPPACFSLDSIKPSPYAEHLESDFCAGCPKNAFGTALKGRGKACKSIKRIHVILEPGQLLPYRLILPPSNLKAFDTYISNLVSRGYPWRMVETLFSLIAVKNKDGITYAEVDCKAIGTLDREQVAISKKISESLMPILRDRDIQRVEE